MKLEDKFRDEERWVYSSYSIDMFEPDKAYWLELNLMLCHITRNLNGHMIHGHAIRKKSE